MQIDSSWHIMRSVCWSLEACGCHTLSVCMPIDVELQVSRTHIIEPLFALKRKVWYLLGSGGVLEKEGVGSPHCLASLVALAAPSAQPTSPYPYGYIIWDISYHMGYIISYLIYHIIWSCKWIDIGWNDTKVQVDRLRDSDSHRDTNTMSLSTAYQWHVFV